VVVTPNPRAGHGRRPGALRGRGTAEARVSTGLQRWNLPETPLRPVIERIWSAIDKHDDWTPLQQWLAQTV
jgi:hypothetical protein